MQHRKVLIATLLVVATVVVGFVAHRLRAKTWREDIAKLPPKERGALLLEDAGCISCHQPGSAFRAPILTGLLGKTRRLTSGEQIVVDHDYIVRSIVDSRAQVVEGYQGVMPSYPERFSREELEAIVETMR